MEPSRPTASSPRPRVPMTMRSGAESLTEWTMPFATSALSVVSPSIDTDAHVFASRRSSSRTCSIGCGGVDSPAACFACRTCNAVSATSFRCASPGNRSRSAEAHDNATRRAPRAVSDRSTGTSTRRSGSRSEFDTTRHGHAALVTTASAVPPRTRTAVRAPRCGPNTMTSARSLSARDPMADAGSPSRMCAASPRAVSPRDRTSPSLRPSAP